MNIVFFIIVTTVLFILQTIVIPSFTWFSYCFDLMIIVVLYLSIISDRHTVLIPVILIGCVMDTSSGTPFFLHIFSYIWVYLLIQLVQQVLFRRSIIFVLIISVVSVLIQQLFLLLSVFVRHGNEAVLTFDYGILIAQLILALIFIPPSVWVLNISRHNWRHLTEMIKKMLVRRYRGEY